MYLAPAIIVALLEDMFILTVHMHLLIIMLISSVCRLSYNIACMLDYFHLLQTYNE